jgi:hypothetical protein
MGEQVTAGRPDLSAMPEVRYPGLPDPVLVDRRVIQRGSVPHVNGLLQDDGPTVRSLGERPAVSTDPRRVPGGVNEQANQEPARRMSGTQRLRQAAGPGDSRLPQPRREAAPH